MFFIQVLEVATRELVVGNDLDLAVTLLRDLDGLAEVADAALNLDLLVEELLEGGDVEDLVRGGLRSVDDELQSKNRQRPTPATQNHRQNLGKRFYKLTFLVTLGPLPLADFFCESRRKLT